jgi:serine/threonine protein kinase
MRIPTIKSMIAFVCMGLCLQVILAAESSCIDKGEYGAIYLYEDSSTHTRFVKKKYAKKAGHAIIQGSLAGNALAKTLEHPGIVRIEEICVCDPDNEGGATVRMEYLAGETLDGIVEDLHREELETKLIVRNVLEIIAYLEKNKIFHRDVKLKNFMFPSPSSISVTLVDWDFACKWMSPHYFYVGTPYYLAPEIVAQRKHYKDQDGIICNLSKIDAWAAGIILYQLVYRDFPFIPAESISALYDQILDPTPIKIPTYAKEQQVSQPLYTLVQHLLDKNAETRWTARHALKYSEWLRLPQPRKQSADDFFLYILFPEDQKERMQVNSRMTVGECMDEIMMHFKIRKSQFDLYLDDQKLNPHHVLFEQLQGKEPSISIKFHSACESSS